MVKRYSLRRIATALGIGLVVLASTAVVDTGAALNVAILAAAVICAYAVMIRE